MFSVSYLPFFFKTIYIIQILLTSIISIEPGNQSVEVEVGWRGMFMALGKKASWGKSWPPVDMWMFYGRITNCLSLGFKLYPFMISVSVGQESGHSVAGSSPESLRKL